MLQWGQDSFACLSMTHPMMSSDLAFSKQHTFEVSIDHDKELTTSLDVNEVPPEDAPRLMIWPMTLTGETIPLTLPHSLITYTEVCVCDMSSSCPSLVP